MATTIERLTGQIVRPAATTPDYSIGDNVSTSTSATETDWLVFQIPRLVEKAHALGIVATKSTTNLTNAHFTLHLFSAVPVDKIADNDALSALELSDLTHYLGSYEIIFDRTLGTFAKCEALPYAVNSIPLVPDENASWEDDIRLIYGVLEARAAYTGGADEEFNFVITAECDVSEDA